jgi:HAE1 family hydrophobic/amphiphilic exporter-1
MTLSDLSIRRPVFAWMLMAALILFGAVSLGRLGVSEMPDVDFPVLTINTSWTGAAPEVMETEIVDRIEESIVSTQGIRDITSSIQQGQASTTIEFDLSRNVDAALTEVQSKISAVSLPVDADLPTITKSNPEDQPILLLAVSGHRSIHELTTYVERSLQDQFKIIPGVGAVTLGGYSKRNLRVWIDNAKLKEYELTVLDVKNAIQQEHIEVAAGYLENSKNEFNVRTMGEGATPDLVGQIQIKQRGGELIYNSNIRIKDVARVEDGLDDVRRFALTNEGTAIGLGIKKQRGANAVQVGRLVKAQLLEIQKTLPSDMKITINFDSTVFIEEAIHETLFTLVLSALITSAVCYLFLGSWSSTFNVLLSIPTSVMGTFIVMYFMGFTLNFFTLLGLSLAIGIVVDDAIMVLENIVRHFKGRLEEGEDVKSAKRNASLTGAREITFAAVAATIAVMAIFLPVAFMSGIIGKFFFQFGITISSAVALSLLEAITITPMRCSQFMSDPRKSGRLARWMETVFDSWAETYRRWLIWCLGHRVMVLTVSFLAFAFSVWVGTTLPKEFVPPQDQGVFLIRAQTPVGSSLNFTRDKLLEAEKIIRADPDVDRFFAAIGGFTQQSGSSEGSVTDDEVNAATVYVTLKPRAERRRGQFAIMQDLRGKLNAVPDLKAVPQDLNSRGFTAQRGFPVELNLRGQDYGILQKNATALIAKLDQSGYLTDIDTDFRTGMPEVRVWPDREAANKSGVTVDSIAQTVSSAIGGVVQGKFTNKDRRYDVRLRLETQQRLQAGDITNLQVRTSYGELIPISSVVRTETVPTFQILTRRLRERSISIFANVAPGKSQAEALNVAEKLGHETLPKDYRLFLGGGAATFRETFTSITFALWLGVLVAYMVLASQFNSYLHPFSVLLALPFSLTGAFLALKLGGQSLNLYSMIGLVLLMGIVKKNSILLVEFTNKKREEGLNLSEAILAAGPIRLRPILMTSFATLAAALPPALALGPGAESRIPLAITVIGGVVVSTGFTLLVVPCAYSLLARLESKPVMETSPTVPLVPEAASV